MLLRAAAILRERKLEFNAWLAYEAGKTWPEAEAETAEAIDFCEYLCATDAAIPTGGRACADAGRTR